jgi:hypothetical protein
MLKDSRNQTIQLAVVRKTKKFKFFFPNFKTEKFPKKKKSTCFGDILQVKVNFDDHLVCRFDLFKKKTVQKTNWDYCLKKWEKYKKS